MQLFSCIHMNTHIVGPLVEAHPNERLLSAKAVIQPARLVKPVDLKNLKGEHHKFALINFKCFGKQGT